MELAFGQNELITIGILFFFSVVAGLIAKRFKQPGVIGLLGVGALIGPNMLGLIGSHELIDATIEFGAIFLLFAIGLEFNIARLRQFWFKAITTALLKVLIIFFIVFEVCMVLFQLSPQASLIISIMLSFSSTVVMTSVLEQRKMINRGEVPLLVALLVIEDVLAVIALTFIAGMQGEASLLESVSHVVFGLLVLSALYVIALAALKPGVKWMIKNSEKDEIILFFALALCAGLSYVAHVLELSPLTGAFMAGSLVATLPNKETFEHYLRPYKATFSSLFFLAIGMLFNFRSMIEHAVIIKLLLVVIVLTRIISIAFAGSTFVNLNGRSMVFSSFALFCIGEFSLLIAQVARPLVPEIDLIAVATAIIASSALVTSNGLRKLDQFYEALEEAIPLPVKERFTGFSHYMNALFEQLDTENAYTKKLKKELVGFFILWPAVLIALYAEVKFVAFLGGDLTILKWLSYAMAVIFVAFIGRLAYQRLRMAHKNLLIVISNMTYSSNLKKSKIIVGVFGRAMVFILLGLAMPAMFSLFGSMLVLNIISFSLLGVGGMYLWRVQGMVARADRNYVYSFPKFKRAHVLTATVEEED